MPSAHEYARVKSENRDLREQVRTAEADKQAAIDAVHHEVEQLKKKLEASYEDRRELADEAARANHNMARQFNEKAAEIVAETDRIVLNARAEAAREVAEERTRLESLRAELDAWVERFVGDVNNIESKLVELVKRIDERGRRKEANKANQLMNGAIMGFGNAREVLRDLAQKIQAKQRLSLVEGAMRERGVVGPQIGTDPPAAVLATRLQGNSGPMLAIVRNDAEEEGEQLRALAGEPENILPNDPDFEVGDVVIWHGDMSRPWRVVDVREDAGGATFYDLEATQKRIVKDPRDGVEREQLRPDRVGGVKRERISPCLVVQADGQDVPMPEVPA